MEQKFDPGLVPIRFALNFQHVNLVLEELGKLPYEKVEQVYQTIRSIAVYTLQDAEREFNDQQVGIAAALTDSAKAGAEPDIDTPCGR